MQGPQAGKGCILAHPDFVEDATGETLQLVRLAVSEGRHVYVLVSRLPPFSTWQEEPFHGRSPSWERHWGE